jgi:exonuclease VII large subunit
MVRGSDGAIIRDAAQAREQDRLHVRLARGALEVIVAEVKEVVE